jgi:hypothetical protein
MAGVLVQVQLQLTLTHCLLDPANRDNLNNRLLQPQTTKME